MPHNSENTLYKPRNWDFCELHNKALCAELGENPAILAHRYALQMDGVDTLVLGVKNRQELQEIVDAEALGALEAEVVAKIDALRLNFFRPKIPMEI